MSKTALYIILSLFFLSFSGSLIAQEKPPKPPLQRLKAPGKDRVEESKKEKAKQQTKNNELLASEYFRQGDFEKSAFLYKSLLDKTPRTLYYMYYLQSMVELKEYSEIEKFVKKQIRKHPNDPRYSVDLGYIYSRKGNNKKAEKIYQNELQKIESSNNQVYLLANAYRSHNLNEYTLKTYLKGREFSQTPQSYGFEIASLHQQNGNYDLMLRECVNILKADPEKEVRVTSRMRSALYNDKDESIYLAMRKTLIKEIQKDDDNIEAMTLLIWLSIQQKNFEEAYNWAQSLDSRLDEDGSRLMEIGRLSSANKDYNSAIKAYSRVVEKKESSKYYIYAQIELLSTKFAKATQDITPNTKELLQLKQDYLKILENYGYNNSTIPLLRSLAQLEAYYLSEKDSAISLLKNILEMPNCDPNQVAQAKMELADIYVFTNNVWDAMLLYMQVEKSHKNSPLGHEAKYRLARLSYYIGEFDWAKSQLDILKGSTTKLIANDAMKLSLLIGDNLDADSTTAGLKYFSKAELLTAQHKYEEALTLLDSIPMLSLTHTLNDEALFEKAMIFKMKKEFTKADSLFNRVANSYSYDILADNALYNLGLLHEEIGNNERAMNYYKELITQFPNSVFTTEARTKFRTIRGDKIDDNQDEDDSPTTQYP